jgi:pilus assembly protein TadC
MLAFLAVAAGTGVFLTVTSLGPRRVRVRLTDPDERPFIDRMLDVLFVPAAERVVTATGRVDLEERKRKLEQRLRRANYPAPFTSPEAVLGYRMLTAVLAAVFGGVFALLVGLGGMALPLMAGLGALGWVIPGRSIHQAVEDRKEQLTLDAASSLDRLAIFVAAGNALPAAVRSLAERSGGAWVGVFRQVASRYAVTGDFQKSFEEVMAGNGRLPDIVRVGERLIAAYEMGGGGIAQSLRRMAGDARTNIRLLITERGYKNAVKMVIPAFLAIIAATIILVAPGAVRMLNVLSGGL